MNMTLRVIVGVMMRRRRRGLVVVFRPVVPQLGRVQRGEEHQADQRREEQVVGAGDLGVPLGRVVVVGVDGGPSVWAERVAAAADGFELVVTHPPVGAERVVRRVRQRLQSNGVVLVAVDPATVPSMGCDLDLVTSRIAWHGIGQGAGHLVARRALVKVGGRRSPRPVERELLLPGPDGRVRECDGGDAAGTVIPLERAG